MSTTTNQKDLIVMAYDGILRFLGQAKDRMAKKEIEGAHDALVRARAVVEELASTLNLEEGGQIAQNLWNMYVFFMKEITEANLTKDPRRVDGILPALRELRDGWAALQIPKDDHKTLALNQRVRPTEEHHRLSVAG